MKITNKNNLPQPLVNAVANDGYTRGDADISVTSLLSPPRKVALESLHKDELTEDVSDRIWSLLGQAVHTILERAATVGIAERRLAVLVDGWRVSGGMDYYLRHGLLQDYKVTTTWKFSDGKVPLEFEQQMNMYAEILRQNGEKIEKLQIVAILRDWSRLEAARNSVYPQSQVLIRDVKLWPSSQARQFLAERVAAHKLSRHVLPRCTPAERWAKPDMFAVMVGNRKKSVRNYTAEAEAREHAARLKGSTVQRRPGQSTRCEHYCSAAPFCRQYQEEILGNEVSNAA